MGRLVPVLGVALALVPATLGAQPLPPELAWRAWFVASLEHQPGVSDQPLVEVGTWGFDELTLVLKNLQTGLRHEFHRQDVRDDVIRRGILLHTEIALLRPDLAVRFDRVERDRPLPTVDVGRDAEYLGQYRTTAHWAFARMLIDRLPDGAADPFARAWYRAVGAWFLVDRELAHAADHLSEALRRLPRDPVLLLYAGVLHETYASGRVQNLLATIPRGRPRPLIVSPHDELERAAMYLRRALTVQPDSTEARLRLGRVLGQLEEHQEALAELQSARAIGASPRQEYFIEMASADALAALGRLDEARAALARASALFPRAQSPILALSALHRRAGDVAGAVAAVARLRELPGHGLEVHDPWWIYFESCVRDAEAQFTRLRAMLGSGGNP